MDQWEEVGRTTAHGRAQEERGSAAAEESSSLSQVKVNRKGEKTEWGPRERKESPGRRDGGEKRNLRTEQKEGYVVLLEGSSFMDNHGISFAY